MTDSEKERRWNAECAERIVARTRLPSEDDINTFLDCNKSNRGCLKCSEFDKCMRVVHKYPMSQDDVRALLRPTSGNIVAVLPEVGGPSENQFHRKCSSRMSENLRRADTREPDDLA